jgi:hypothetical protein
MNRRFRAIFTTLALVFALSLSGCDFASSARDTIATSFGYLTWAQATYKTQCQAAPTASTCSLITRAIGLNNAAVDSLNAYCNGPVAAGGTPWTNGGPCVPIKGAQGTLQAALNALTPVIADLKLLATGKSVPKLTVERLLHEPQTQATLLSVRIAEGR